MRLEIVRSRRFVAVLTVLLGLFAATSVMAQSRGRILGQLVGPDDTGMTKVTIQFTALGDKEIVRTVVTRKKGRFSESGLPPGRYRVELVDSDFYISKLDFDIRREDGLQMGSGSIEGHPRDGVVGLPISPQHEVNLTLVAEAKGPAELGQADLKLEATELVAATKLYNQEEFADVVTETERVLAEQPELAEGYYLLGIALEKLGRHAPAETNLSQAAGRMPEFPGIWVALAEATLNLAVEQETAGETTAARVTYGRAVDVLTQAIQRNDEALPLKINLAACLDRTGQEQRLMTVLQQILEQDSTHIPSRIRLASLHSKGGDHDTAMALLQQIPETEKQVAVTLYNIAVGLSEDNDLDGALMAARRAAEIDPQLPQAKQLVAQTLLGKGDHPAAIVAIREFLEIATDPTQAEMYQRILTQLESN